MLFNIRGDPEIIINQCSKLSGAILGLITIVCGYIYSNIERISTSEGVLLVIAVILLCIGLWGSILVISMGVNSICKKFLTAHETMLA